VAKESTPVFAVRRQGFGLFDSLNQYEGFRENRRSLPESCCGFYFWVYGDVSAALISSRRWSRTGNLTKPCRFRTFQALTRLAERSYLATYGLYGTITNASFAKHGAMVIEYYERGVAHQLRWGAPPALAH